MTRTMPLTHGTQGDTQTVCGMDLENSYYGRLREVIKQNTAVLMTDSPWAVPALVVASSALFQCSWRLVHVTRHHVR